MLSAIIGTLSAIDRNRCPQSIGITVRIRRNPHVHDELMGSAVAIVEGVDGRTHHLRFSDVEMIGDAIVEARVYEAPVGRKRLSLVARSDLTVEAQIMERLGSIGSFSAAIRRRAAADSVPRYGMRWTGRPRSRPFAVGADDLDDYTGRPEGDACKPQYGRTWQVGLAMSRLNRP
jgi:hypothetical protein